MKNKSLLLKIIFLILGVLLVCSSVRPVLAKPKNKNTDYSAQISQMQTQLNNLKEKLDKTIKMVNGLSGKVSRLDKSDAAPVNYSKQISQLDSTLHVLQTVTASLSNDVVRLQRQVNQNAQRASYTDSINFEILSQLIILENRIVSLGSSLSETKTLSNSEPSEKPTVTKRSYRDRYLQALTMHQGGNNEGAISLFRQLLNEDQYHELADNAQYWIGECFYSMKQYRRAIVEFEKVFAFKNSNKEDDAQFKLGLCYAALGERDKAIDEFQRLIDYYPQSEFVTNAKQFVK